MAKIKSKVSKSAAVNFRARCFVKSIPYFLATAIERLSGNSPTWYAAVPAESTTCFFDFFFSLPSADKRDSLDCKMPSANGERQILPKHTINMFMKCSLER